MMAQYIDLSKFKAIYVVDLCHSLCEVAKRKAKAKGWKNVHVVEADACAFTPPEGAATLITFSYSLTSAMAALDDASTAAHGLQPPTPRISASAL
jgi:betaine lipid synthase